MKVNTTYEIVKSSFPNEVQIIIEKLRKGKSKEKNSDPNELTWYFNWGIYIRDNNHVLENALENACYSLHAKKKRWWGGVRLYKIPDQVREAVEQYSLAQKNFRLSST